MEQIILDLVAKFPLIATVYGIASGAYIIFCAVASLTKTQKDDKIADKLQTFFSIKLKK